MSAALFALGFLATGIAGAEYLAKHDPEPIGAFASVLLFCILAAASSVMVYVAIPYKSNRVPGVVASLLSGALSASAFCAAIGCLYLGMGFWSSLCLAFVSSALLAAGLA